MVGVLMIMCEKKGFSCRLYLRETRRAEGKATSRSCWWWETSSKHHICCFTSRFLVEEHCNMGTKAGPCLKVEIGR